MNICLKTMTKELARQYFRQFELDPALFADPAQYAPYVYSQDKADAVVERYRKLGRVYFAVMLGDEPIGEVVLKNIDRGERHCTLGISMRSDAYKNQGYGTRAEQLALQYAFDELGMTTVFADSLIGNTRSRRVLEKVGFREISRDEAFAYYRCDKSSWDDCSYA